MRFDVPSVAQIELTYECNNHCCFCYNYLRDGKENKSYKNELNTKLWKDIILKLKKAGVFHVLFTGGEPLLREDIAELVKFAVQNGLSCTINTNGRKITEELANLLEKYDVNLNISLHSLNRSMHNFLTNTASFDQVIENFGILSKHNIITSFNTTVTTKNLKDLDPTIDFVINNLNANFTATRFISCDPSQKYLELKGKNILKLKKIINENVKKYKNRVRLLTSIPLCSYPEEPSSTQCTAGKTWITIDPEGYIRPCTHSPSKFGNAINDDIAEIWHSKEMSDWVNNIPQKCMSCDFLEDCGGGCKASAEICHKPHDPLITFRTKNISSSLVSYENEPLSLNEPYRFIEKPRIRKMDDENIILFTLNKSFVLNNEAYMVIKNLEGDFSVSDLIKKFPENWKEDIITLFQELNNENVLGKNNAGQ